MSECYYQSNGLSIGPLSVQHMHTAARIGTITAETLVWSPGCPSWMPFEEWRTSAHGNPHRPPAPFPTAAGQARPPAAPAPAPARPAPSRAPEPSAQTFFEPRRKTLNIPPPPIRLSQGPQPPPRPPSTQAPMTPRTPEVSRPPIRLSHAPAPSSSVPPWATPRRPPMENSRIGGVAPPLATRPLPSPPPRVIRLSAAPPQAPAPPPEAPAPVELVQRPPTVLRVVKQTSTVPADPRLSSGPSPDMRPPVTPTPLPEPTLDSAPPRPAVPFVIPTVPVAAPPMSPPVGMPDPRSAAEEADLLNQLQLVARATAPAPMRPQAAPALPAGAPGIPGIAALPVPVKLAPSGAAAVAIAPIQRLPSARASRTDGKDAPEEGKTYFGLKPAVLVLVVLVLLLFAASIFLRAAR